MTQRQQAVTSVKRQPAAKRAPRRTLREGWTDERALRAAPAADQTLQVSAPERAQMIATAAYYRAQERGFVPGFELRDWLEAEAAVDRLLMK
jgi:hypothetical protein